jgi:hypothetical protein
MALRVRRVVGSWRERPTEIVRDISGLWTLENWFTVGRLRGNWVGNCSLVKWSIIRTRSRLTTGMETLESSAHGKRIKHITSRRLGLALVVVEP